MLHYLHLGTQQQRNRETQIDPTNKPKPKLLSERLQLRLSIMQSPSPERINNHNSTKSEYKTPSRNKPIVPPCIILAQVIHLARNSPWQNIEPVACGTLIQIPSRPRCEKNGSKLC